MIFFLHLIQVEEIELLLASGVVKTLTRDNDEDLFRAASVALGTLGIILSVKLKVEPAFKLEHTQTPDTLEHVNTINYCTFKYYIVYSTNRVNM